MNVLSTIILPPKPNKNDFFLLDKPTDPFKKLWNKITKTFPTNLLNENVFLKFQMIKQGKKLHLMNTRYYYLTQDHIYYKKVIIFFDFFK